MDLLDLVKLTPRGALSQLGYSLVPGTILLGGVTWIRWDLAEKFLASQLLDPVLKDALLLCGLEASGFLLLSLGSFLVVFWAVAGAVLGNHIKEKFRSQAKKTLTGGPDYGSNVPWRRLVGRLLGETIGQIQEPIASPDAFRQNFKTMIESRLAELLPSDNPLPPDLPDLREKLSSTLFEESSKMVIEIIDTVTISTEWQSIHRMLNARLARIPPEVGYFPAALLSSGSVMWTLYHFWLTGVIALWIAAFLTTSFGAILAICYGLGSSIPDFPRGADEKQGALLLNYLIPERDQPPSE